MRSAGNGYYYVAMIKLHLKVKRMGPTVKKKTWTSARIQNIKSVVQAIEKLKQS